MITIHTTKKLNTMLIITLTTGTTTMIQTNTAHMTTFITKMCITTPIITRTYITIPITMCITKIFIMMMSIMINTHILIWSMETITTVTLHTMMIMKSPITLMIPTIGTLMRGITMLITATLLMLTSLITTMTFPSSMGTITTTLAISLKATTGCCLSKPSRRKMRQKTFRSYMESCQSTLTTCMARKM